jgi:hypothetical protein
MSPRMGRSLGGTVEAGIPGQVTGRPLECRHREWLESDLELID